MRRRQRRPHRQPEVKQEGSGPTHWFAVLNERHISSEVVDGREDLAAFCVLHGIRRVRHPYSRVDVSRNRIAKKFMEITTHPESSLTMLDTDHLHSHDVVLKLIEDNLPVVGALVFRGGEPFDPQVYVMKGEDLAQPIEWTAGVMEADIVGAAALCIRRKVFTELEAKGFRYPWFRMIYEDGEDTFLGEDWDFSQKCRKAGIKLYCDMRLISPHQDVMWIDEKPWLIRQGKLVPDQLATSRPEPWLNDPTVMQDAERKWQELKDIHKGETGLIIGNGPSLKDTPLEFLHKYPSFGTNRIYRLAGFTPYYYAAVNPLVLDQFGREMLQAYKGKVRRFFLSEHYLAQNLAVAQQPTVVPVRSLGDPQFFPDPRAGLYEGHTVSFVALQLAYWMGFSTILLVGVDHRYTHEGNPNQELIAQGEDPNHFDPRYFSDGNKWHAPDLVRSAEAYQMARTAFEADSRRIINLTPNSALEVFERQEWQVWR